MKKNKLISATRVCGFILAFLFTLNANCLSLVAATGDGNDEYIHDADKSTGLLSSGRPSRWFNALDAAPDNVLYGATNSLYTLDPSSGAYTLIGDMPDSVESIAFSPDGRLYGMNVGGAILYEIDPTTGDFLSFTFTSQGNMNAMDFGPDGLLYGLDRVYKKIYTVDTSTGVFSYLTTMNGVTPGPFNSMDYGNDGVIRVYGWIEPDRHYYGLYEINPQTGLSTLIGPAQISSLPISIFGLASIVPNPTSVDIDITGGDVQECSQTGGTLVSATANITLDPDDAVSGISWLLDGVNAGNDTEFSQFVTLGTHQIEVNVTTVNGDSALDVMTVTVEDTQPPIVTAQFINRLTGEPINTLQQSRNLIEINAEASDVCDPSAAVIDAIYGNPTSDGSVFLAIGFGGGLVTPQNQLVLRVVAQDASGNRASAFSVLNAP